LNHQLKGELANPMQIGIGIHHAEAIVGMMGPPRSMIITAIGDTVNTAARLESLTKEYGCPVIISRRAAQLAQAVRAAQERGGEAVIHCGDVIGTQTLRAAMAVGLPMHVIHGNNLGDPVSLSRWARESKGQLEYHGPDARLELASRRIFVVHYPEYGY